MLLLWLAAAPGAGARRELQGAASGAVDEPWCAQLAERGVLVCDVHADLCPQACAAAGTQPPPPPAWCAQLAERGSLQCDVNADLCPDACAVGVSPQAPAFCTDLAAHAELQCGASSRGVELCPEACAARGQLDGAQTPGFRLSCPVLLQLEDGCAHDLSVDDPSIAAGTHVSDACPHECSGHVGCLPSTLDVSFLGVAEDSSGHGRAVELVGDDLCLDSAGLPLRGEGHVEVVLGGQYAEGREFSVAFWLLKEADVAVARDSRQEVLFWHPPRVPTVDAIITVSLSRADWLDAWVLRVAMSGFPFTDFQTALNRDATPMWAHISILVSHEQLRVYENGQAVTGQVADRAAVVLRPGVAYRRWDDILGIAVADMLADPRVFMNLPDVEEVLTDFFETPTNVYDEGASELRSFFLAPISGSYTFFVAADDSGELWFGATEESSTVIASAPGWTSPRQYDKYLEQTSAPQMLSAGEYYFMRALEKEDAGGDNLSVGMTMPDGTEQKPIHVGVALTTALAASGTVVADSMNGIGMGGFRTASGLGDIAFIGATPLGTTVRLHISGKNESTFNRRCHGRRNRFSPTQSTCPCLSHTSPTSRHIF